MVKQHAFPYFHLAKPLKSTSFYYFNKENIYLIKLSLTSL